MSEQGRPNFFLVNNKDLVSSVKEDVKSIAPDLITD
jgi:hypothetical protein